MKRIAVLGSTGSIGRNALSVISHLPGCKVASLAAGSNADLLARQALHFGAEVVAIADDTSVSRLRSLLPPAVRVLCGLAGIEEAASVPDADLVIVAISGAAGLPATLAAIRAGKTVALANKESLVMAGGLVTRLARAKGVTLLPVDSEHSAIFQAMACGRRDEVRRVIITASGGPFLDAPLHSLKGVTPELALKHPTWSMGRKITIDSATMMNKALEVIEARWLFGLETSQIEVVIHPQSIVHSLVEFRDGAVLAQLGVPDMRVPIQYAITWPERLPGPVPPPDLARIGRLEFLEPDPERFPALKLGYRAAEEGGLLGAVLNAANEVAVEEFLQGRISLPEIAERVGKVMDLYVPAGAGEPDLEQILEADRWARQAAARSMSLS